MWMPYYYELWIILQRIFDQRKILYIIIFSCWHLKLTPHELCVFRFLGWWYSSILKKTGKLINIKRQLQYLFRNNHSDQSRVAQRPGKSPHHHDTDIVDNPHLELWSLWPELISRQGFLCSGARNQVHMEKPEVQRSRSSNPHQP